MTGLPAGLLARFDIQAVNCPSCSSPLTRTEFRFTGPPLSGLQGIDNFSQVIYAGTMSKILYPSLRLGYVVAPEQLIDSLVKIRSTMDQHSSAIDQATLARFINEGFFLSPYQTHAKTLR